MVAMWEWGWGMGGNGKRKKKRRKRGPQVRNHMELSSASHLRDCGGGSPGQEPASAYTSIAACGDAQSRGYSQAVPQLLTHGVRELVK